MKILIEAVLSAALSLSCLCGAELYLTPTALPRPLPSQSSGGIPEVCEEISTLPNVPQSCDAALDEALRKIASTGNRQASCEPSEQTSSVRQEDSTDSTGAPSHDRADTAPDAEKTYTETDANASDDTSSADTDVYPAVCLGYTDDSVIYVYDHSTGCTISTTLGEYAEGVCRAEMPGYFDTEALRAQAIAARTYAVYKLMQGPPDSEHGRACVCNEPAHCCAYRSAEGLYTDVATQAVADTRNIIVTSEGMSICAAWHSRSVGRTRSAAEVWGGYAPYLSSVPTEEDAATCLGHGVGMSQYGALSMAERGICARDILLHYYTDCRLSLLS